MRTKRYAEGDLVGEDEGRMSDLSTKVETGEGPQAKPKVVTKEELEKSGLTLREYMNRQQGLKPRGESESAKSKLDPEMASRTTSRAASKSEPSRKDTGLFNKIRERSGNLPPEVPSKGNEQAKAKYEAYRNAPSPADNMSSMFKKIRDKAGFTPYKEEMAKGGKAYAKGGSVSAMGSVPSGGKRPHGEHSIQLKGHTRALMPKMGK